jgi:polysaccharide pyruvyl transferase WcaK-like protein
MHTFSVGGDDRTFYRRFTDTYFKGTEFHSEVRPSSVDQIARAMTSSSLNLCMRFHSVLFAHTLDTNFLAIDYTRGGKIKGFLTDNNSIDKMLPLEEIADDANFSILSKVGKI